MVSKKNFVQNRPMPYKKPAGIRASVRQFNQFSNQMLNVSQIPDTGYVDFNNMNLNSTTQQNNGPQAPKKKNIKNKQKNKPNIQQQQQNPQNGNNWRKNKNMQQQQRGPAPNQKFNNQLIEKRVHPMNNQQRGGFPPLNAGPMNMRGGNHRLMPPNGMGPRRMPAGFQRPPMMPPIPPHMGPMRPPMQPMNMPQPPPSFMRRSGRRPQGNIDGNFKKQMFPRPPMNMPPMNMPPMNMPMMPPMMPVPPRMPFNAMGLSPGKVKKPNPKIVKKIVKGKSTIKTLKNLQNQYPIDKPWVTDDIKTEHGKKVEIENQLKGKKDDELFAQFKAQRDKFVSLYETAREEYLKKEAAQVKTKDANGKQTNNKNTAKNGKNNEKQIPNSNANPNANENGGYKG